MDERRFAAELDLPGAAGDVLVHAVRGSEVVSQGFSVSIDVSVEDIDVDAARGSEARLHLTDPHGNDRWLCGIVRSIEVMATSGEGSKPRVRVGLGYRHELLKLRKGFRIFQNLSFPDVVKAVFTRAGIEDAHTRFALTGTYPERTYCVQYDETEWDFVCRLLEEEGIFFRFEHSADGHVMVIEDDSTAAPPIGQSDLAFQDDAGAQGDVVKAWDWAGLERDAVAQVILGDYDGRHPDARHYAEAIVKDDPGSFGTHYEHPARTVNQAHAKRLAVTRLEELQVVRKQSLFRTNAVTMVAGQFFDLVGHPFDDGPHYVVAVNWLVRLDAEEGAGPLVDPGPATFVAQVLAMPKDRPFRPARATRRPIVAGLQTALVTGPGGEEIHCDELGRIKVQFPWDLDGKLNEHTSCWVRVAQMNTTGAIAIPRIGWEVLIEFQDGDPDRPLCLGRTFNPAFPPAYPLPEGKTISGHRSDSTPGGGGMNELRFDDAPGHQQIVLHAEHDLNVRVKNDRHLKVGQNAQRGVGNNRQSTVNKNETVVVQQNFETRVGGTEGVHIVATHSVKADQDTSEVIKGNLNLTVGALETLNVGDLFGALKGMVAAAAVEAAGTVAKSVAKGVVDRTVGAAKTKLEAALLKPLKPHLDKMNEALGDAAVVPAAVKGMFGKEAGAALVAKLPNGGKVTWNEQQIDLVGAALDPGSAAGKIAADQAKKLAKDATESMAAGAGNWSTTVGGDVDERIGGVSTLDTMSAFQLTVKGNSDEAVGAVRLESVGGKKSESTGKAKGETVAGAYTLETQGGVTHEIKGLAKYKIGGSQKHIIKKGRTLKAKKALEIKTKKLKLQAVKALTLKCGMAEVVLNDEGIVVKGGDVTVNGKDALKTKGKDQIGPGVAMPAAPVQQSGNASGDNPPATEPDKTKALGGNTDQSIQKCTSTGHPVDVANGRVFTSIVDFEIGGPLPIKWERIWYSRSLYRGPLGHGWHHPYDLGLLDLGTQVDVRLADGRVISFAAPPVAGGTVFNRSERMTLLRTARGFGLRGADGLTWWFSAAPRGGDPQVVEAIEDRAGNAIGFRYDNRGRLIGLIAPGGRLIAFVLDGEGRILAVDGPPPAGNQAGTVRLASYRYDGDGDLVEARDALDQAHKFTYSGHLMTRETNRNGLSFFFEYEGLGREARCTRTWGDGGIYDHKLRYEPGVTVVTNSLGFDTTYHHRNGLVWKTEDALGGVTETKFNRHDEVVGEQDAAGGQTTFVRDERGNAVSVIAPDGGQVAIEYDGEDRPVVATDAVGGRWQWTYGEDGFLRERRDPLGAVTKYHHHEGRLVTVADAAGHVTSLGYDEVGNLTWLRTPDGGESRWDYDRWGRCVRASDAKGNVQVRVHDALGRVVRVEEPDGQTRELAYDPEGNVVHAKDKHHDVTFAYGGMNRLVSRTEAGTTVEFAYDTEERLVGIKNEHGFVYKFELDAAGGVLVESGFDGVTRVYSRDGAGRVQKVERPGGLMTEYAYDEAGRVLGVAHSDGAREAYEYRLDGTLMAAINDDVAVRFERDLLGRVLRESQGDEWVESTYDVMGRRVGMRSSMGARQVIDRNAMGDVLGVSAGLDPLWRGSDKQAQGEATAGRRVGEWSATFSRDQLGLEIERALPGGVRARWDRDRLGRPVRQEISVGGQTQRARGYTWDANDRLLRIVDSLRGPTEYSHDKLGNLAKAAYADGTVDLRLPDAVGNLFRSEKRDDRKYGAAGQLIEARGPKGVTKYEYDAEGNLIRKVEGDGAEWGYEWNGAGMLARVRRPDGGEVTFKYDALGRRVEKGFAGKKTRWVWDGNVVLHEWVEGAAGGVEAPEGVAPEIHEAVMKFMAKNRKGKPPIGPPADGSRARPITWLFEPESFAPLAKLVGEKKYGIVTDHLGTPVGMYDASGAEVWSAEIGAYGQLRGVEGEKSACPWRWPGQYEDEETGLYYNRFRYYDPEAGEYVSQDPIRTSAGICAYTYPFDPLSWVDPAGLAICQTAAHELTAIGPLKGRQRSAIESDLAARGFSPTTAHSGGTVWTKAMGDGNTAAVRLDPPVIRSKPKNWADEVPHAHKEIVPTAHVVSGNYPQNVAARIADNGAPALSPADAHIPIVW